MPVWAAGLDTISHAMESLWNKNRNAITVALAMQAAEIALSALPKLKDDPENISLRAKMQEASLMAGLAISQTHTALAHAISYHFTHCHTAYQKWSEKNGHWLKCISCSKLTKIEGAVKNGEREQKESWVSVQGQGGVGGN